MSRPYSTAELREAYLRFFEERGHERRVSASLLPEADPTTLFTVAGMAQFKDMFLGRGNLPCSRATTCQKCMRTTDILQVGRTPRHHTFFEMLGNFSFNDYFKQETIAWAWEFLTEVVGFPAERLWISVHESDEEAYRIWNEDIGVPAERLLRLGDADNFWPADAPAEGPTGPGGCCSEIFWDYQSNDDPDDDPSKDSDRFVEIWNLVFPQYNVAEPRVDGRYTLEELGRRNIDTGMGLERLAAVVQGKRNNFDNDLLSQIVNQVSAVTQRPYVAGVSEGAQGECNARIRRIADHVRAVAFAIADGALPGNAGRGYVIRRLIRRATLDLDQLGVREPSLHRVLPVVVDVMADPYQELRARQQLADDTLQSEERLFRRTLDRGLELLRKTLARHQDEGRTVFSGDDLFDLFTTYGFPHETTEELVRAEGLEVDRRRFDERMKEFAEVSRGGRQVEVFTASALADGKPRLGATEFVGYDQLACDAVLTLLELDGQEVSEAEAGSAVRFALDRTPFYAESGGQVGDTGELRGDGFWIRVDDVQKDDGLFVHYGHVAEGVGKPGEVRAAVDAERRAAIIRHHSATHLLHSGLRAVLGDHVEQQGSKVEDEVLRFDFNHPRQPSDKELRRVEAFVADAVRRDVPVEIDEMELDQAREAGAKALFGEKYGERVRVVSMGGPQLSMELCGGCHVGRSGDIGAFRIVREEAVSAGVRRVTAVAGRAATALADEEERLAQEAGRELGLENAAGVEIPDLAHEFKVAPKDVPARVQALSQELHRLCEELGEPVPALRGGLRQRVQAVQAESKRLRKLREQVQAQRAVAALDALLAGERQVAGVPLIVGDLGGIDGKGLREAAEAIKGKRESFCALLGGNAGGKAALVAVVSPDVVERGVSAGDLVRRVAEQVGGRGGGRPEQAQGGGPDGERLRDALDSAEGVVEEMVRGAQV